MRRRRKRLYAARANKKGDALHRHFYFCNRISRA
jgi:hypothetical protein